MRFPFAIAALLVARAGALSTWPSLGLSAPVAEALQALGDFEAPTEVQSCSIPPLLAGEDVLIHAQTGSGKTLAYLAPLFSRVDAARQTTQAVVVLPSRELGLQVAKVSRRMAKAMNAASDGKPIMVMSCMDGSSLRRQKKWAWAEPPHVVVGNAKAVHEMAKYGGLRCADAVEFVVIDEVDAFFDPARADDRDALHSFLVEALAPGPSGGAAKGKKRKVDNAARRSARQTVFATASLEQPRHLASRLAQMRWTATSTPPTYVNAGAALPEQLRHYAALAPMAERAAALRAVLDDASGAAADGTFAAIVFCDGGRDSKALAADLGAAGLKIAVLDEGDDLGARQAALEAYAAGDADVLLAADGVAARGIDAPRTSCVVQFDFPRDATAYLHRAGRTARLGRPGAVLTLLDDAQRKPLDRFANYLHIDIADITMDAAGTALLAPGATVK